MHAVSFCIRAAHVEDALEIATCLEVLGYDIPVAAVQKKLEAFATCNSDCVFVAVNAALVVGTVSVHLIPLFHTFGYLARLTTLSVRDGHQRQGIGKELLLAAEKWASDAGALRVEVTSGDHRPIAHAFYEHHGYLSNERRFIKHLPAHGVAS